MDYNIKEWNFNKIHKKLISLFIIILIFNISIITINVTADSDDFTLKWSTNYGYESYSVPVAADINNDGIFEIFVGGRHSSGSYCGISCINSSTGDIIWSETINTLQSYHVPIAISDLDDDGDYELVHAAGSRTVARNCEDGSVFWDVATDSAWGVPAIADFDGTGIPYVIVGDNSCFNSPVTLSKLYGNNGSVAASSTEISYTCFGGVSIADLNRDGEYEIVMSDSGTSHCFDEELNELWTTGSYTSESHCAILVNVTGDADLEVVIMDQASSGVENGGIHVYSADGTPVPGKSSSDLDLTTHCQPAVYDIDKDGNVELITAYNHVADVWDLGSWSLDATLERGSEPPDIANVIGDSDLEIVSPFAFSDGNVDIYDSSYNNPLEIKSVNGLNTLVLDFDDDGLNELLIHGIDGSMYLYDTLAESFTPCQRGDTSYYSERRTNSGIYIPKIGKKCIIDNPNIANGSVSISLSTSTLSIDINEPDGDPIDWTIETNPNIGSSNGFNELNGTKNCEISGLDASTTYTWVVNATDGTNYISESFQFTTEDGSSDESSFYVDADSGSDDNDGSLSNPWETIQHAANNLEAGDTVYIKEGIYYEYLNPWLGMTSGTKDNWITYTNFQNDEVIIDGTGGTNDWTGIIKMDNQAYIEISNLTLRNSCSHGILFHDGSGDAHNVTIKNCTIINCSDSAIQIKGYNDKLCDVLIENNTIIDTENGWNDDGFPSDESITVGNVDRFIIRNNLMYDNHKICIDAKAGSQNGLIYNNRINTTGSWVAYGIEGIYIDAQSSICKNISIFNNIIWGNGTGFQFGTEQGGVLENIRFFNNIYNGSENGFQINNHTSVSGSHLKKNVSIINNICSENSNICFQITDPHSSFYNLTIRNNIFNGSIGINIGQESDLDLTEHHVDHNLFNVSSGSDYYGTNSINASPSFTNPELGDYTLQMDSPAIDSGSLLYAPSVDIDGTTRPQGSSIDIGVYETSSGDDSSAPVISDVVFSSSVVLDTTTEFGWENISCTVTDDLSVEDVMLYITNPNDERQIKEMDKQGTSDSYYYNTTLNLPGNYTYFIYANDTSNNEIQTANNYYSLPFNWDINHDGYVTMLDMVLISNKLGQTSYPGWIREDIDNNGLIQLLDIVLVSNHLNETWYI